MNPVDHGNDRKPPPIPNMPKDEQDFIGVMQEHVNNPPLCSDEDLKKALVDSFTHLSQQYQQMGIQLLATGKILQALGFEGMVRDGL